MGAEAGVGVVLELVVLNAVFVILDLVGVVLISVCKVSYLLVVVLDVIGVVLKLVGVVLD